MARIDARRTNLAVFALVLVASVTGFSTFLAGSPSFGWLFWIHGAIGFSLACLLWWKWKVIVRGLRARWPSVSAWLSIITLAILLSVLAAGMISALVRGGKIGPWSMLELHVGGALIIIPLFVVHLAGRWVPPARRDLSRRVFVRAGALLGAGAALRVATQGVAHVAHLAGASRRFTGSHLTGSPGEGFPTVSWMFDNPARIDARAWSLELKGHVSEPASITYDELAALPQERVAATIDCTGGWYSAQEWEGVRLGVLLDRAGLRSSVRSIVVGSVTGYARAYPVDEARDMLLALRVGGRPLEHGHGFPARVVAPGRRGFWWVKWVTEIEASASPSWLQTPIPLQ